MQATAGATVRWYPNRFREREDPASVAVWSLFPVLFGRNLNDNNESFQGFLEAIGTYFEVHPDLYYQPRDDFETQIMNGLGFVGYNHWEQRALAFWLYLARVVFPSVVANYRPIAVPNLNYHNMFGFVMGFPLKQTKVVLMGQDPSPVVNSSGYAFHLSPSYSTTKILGYVRDDFRQLGDILIERSIVRMSSSNVPAASISRVNGNANLQDWIDQRVLMVNARLTIEEDCWDHFTTFLVRYLNENCTNLVFILCGEVAQKHAPSIHPQRHQVFKVVHPHGITSNPGLRWHAVRPFLNGAFYRFVRTGEVIDWLGVYFPIGTRERRVRLIKQGFNIILLELLQWT